MHEISYSEYSIWRRSEDEWYKQYVLGIKPAASREMILGSILHEAALLGGDYATALAANHFTPDYARAARTLVEWQGWAQVPMREEKRTVGKLQAKYDGISYVSHHIWELKTGKSHWTQERADGHDQITFYCLVYRELFDRIPTATLVSASVASGKVKTFETRRSEEQINELSCELIGMAEYIERHGWWGKRSKFNQ